MKRLVSLIFIAIFFLPSLWAQNQLENYPLPEKPDTLRILAIGNSFSDDGTEYVPALLEAAGIDNVIIARLYIGGCSLERHCKEYEENLNNYVYWKSTDNKWVKVNEKAGILEGLKDEPWDVITIQETSGHSGTYETYQEWIPRLIRIIRKEAVNPHATIAWHQTWAYASNSTHQMFALYGRDQARMHAAIADCVSRAREEFNIPVVIPSGVAVALARETRLNNQDEVPADSKVYQLTRDGYHLSRQHGRYLAACVWFESLIEPVFGISVKGNSCRLLDTEYSIPKNDASLCQKLAVKAVKAVEPL